MAKKPFVPPISAGLVGKGPKAQKQYIAKRFKDHYKGELPLHFFIPRTKPKQQMPQTVAAIVNDDIEVFLNGVNQLDDRIELLLEAVGLKIDNAIIINQHIHVPDGTKRTWVNEEDGITYTTDNLVEDPEAALMQTISKIVTAWE